MGVDNSWEKLKRRRRKWKGGNNRVRAGGVYLQQ